MNKKITIAIYGNTVDTWAVAAGLSKALTQNIKMGSVSLTVIEPSSPDTTTDAITSSPQDVNFHNLVGIKEQDLIKHCDGVFSLGFSYQLLNSTESDCRFFGFGDYGYSLNGIPFQSLWTKYYNNESKIEYDEFSLAAQCVKFNKFIHPQKNKNPLLASFDYAINVDKTKYCQRLKNICLKSGITLHEQQVMSIHITPENSIDTITLQNGECIAADIFIDCSGQQTLANKINGVLAKSENAISAVIAATSSTSLRSSTKLTCHNEGWLKTTTLVDKTVYSFTPDDKKMNANDAISFLKNTCNLSSETRVCVQNDNMPLDTAFWNSNVIAMGNATSLTAKFIISPIQLIYKQIMTFIELIPLDQGMSLCSKEYNRRLSPAQQNISEIYNIHQLPLCSPEQEDTYLSQKMEHLVELFKERGRVTFMEESMLNNKQWATLLICLGIKPRSYDPILDKFNFDDQVKQLGNGLGVIAATVSRLPDINEYQQHYLAHINLSMDS